MLLLLLLTGVGEVTGNLSQAKVTVLKLPSPIMSPQMKSSLDLVLVLFEDLTLTLALECDLTPDPSIGLVVGPFIARCLVGEPGGVGFGNK